MGEINNVDIDTIEPMPPEGTDKLSLMSHTRHQYLTYGMFALTERALPDVRDGLKPGQRRIIHAMNEMGKDHKVPHVKSARIVGDVLGKYHPHGDSAIYGTMVLLSQNFSVRYPLLDGVGNWGSRDGDNAAAMRYTECRLSPIAQTLLSEVKLGTVAFKKNFDGTLLEPTVLPARLPMVLLNGISGIAVGMATEIPPNNLCEVMDAALAIIDNPDLSHDDLLDIVPGPDFPEGGTIISSRAEIKSAYETGKGRVRVRAKWHVEEYADKQWKVIITELPPSANVEGVLTLLESLLNPRGNELSDKQRKTKAVMQRIIGSMRNETDLKSGMRLAIEPKSSKQDPVEMMDIIMLLAKIEVWHSINLVSIGLDGKPKQRSFLEMLKQWVANRFDDVTRRTDFKLKKALDRIHILEGRIIAHLNIDAVIEVIRSSDEPKPVLMSKFNLSDIQAEDILEIKLRQLSKMDKDKLEGELSEKNKERDSY